MGLPKAILFDMDGLILDTEPLANEAIQHASKTVLGVTLSDDILMPMIGMSGSDCIIYLGNVLQRDIPSETLNNAFYTHYDELLAKGIEIKPGCVQLLDFLDQHNIPRIVATSSITEIAIKKLASVGLLERFACVIGGDQVKNSKPNPAIYQRAAKTMGMPPDQCLALEDSENGVRSAHAAGVPVICVPDIKHPSDDVQRLAHKILPSLTAVKQYLNHFV